MSLFERSKREVGAVSRRIPTSNIIKLMCVVLLFLSAQVSANGYAQKITIVGNNINLSEIFKAIELQTGYLFFYDKDAIQHIAPINVSLKNATLDQALSTCLKDQQLTYSIVKNTIVIQQKKTGWPGNAKDIATDKSNPPVEIKGRVLNRAGHPLEGVSVVIAGTKKGTTTNSDGRFTLTVITGKDVVLEISNVGFQTKTVNAGKQSDISITLEEDITGLSSVVVVGYGTQKKTSLTAAISTLKGTDIASTPITDLSNGLGGRMAGVIFRQGSGEPGLDASNIYIRGISTTGNNTPLLIVDDIPRSFQNLDPNSIATITVLKDAAAVAPYGVAGANGVILVTTKRGKTGSPSLTYNGYAGFQNATVLPQYPNAYQYAQLVNAAAANAGLPAKYADYALKKYKDGSLPDQYPNSSPWNLINKNTLLTNHNIEISGGTDKIKYYSSIGYQSEKGMFQSTNQKRFNASLKVDAQVTNSTKISVSVNGTVQANNYPSTTTQRIFQTISNANPTWVQMYSNGTVGQLYAGFLHGSGYRRVNTTQVYSQLSLEQDLNFLPGLKLKGTVAYDPTVIFNKSWLTPITASTLDTTTSPYSYHSGILEQFQTELNQTVIKTAQQTYQLGLNYAHTFNRSNVAFLALFESKANDIFSFGGTRRNYGLNIDELSMGSSSQADISNTGSSSKARQVGLVYRATYDYAGKYLLEASGRYDGSYYFAPQKQFGFFPSFSAGWRLSEENFIKKNLTWVDNLKIRASYGEVGALAGSAFQYLSTYSVYGPATVIGGNAVQAIRERTESNPNITWERAKKYDVGMELSLWKGLLNIEADYFSEKRSNMLTNPDVITPAEYGIGLSQVNAGIMKNHGIDVTVGSIYNVSKSLQFSINGNFTFAQNTLLQIFETAATYSNPNRRLTGRSLGSQFGFESMGFFQVDDFDQAGKLKSTIATQPWGKVVAGDIRYRDLNGDGKIDNNDLKQIGNPQTPGIIYGINPGVKYKGFALDVLFQGAAKTSFYGSGSYAWAFSGGTVPVIQNLDYWTPQNIHAKNPRITSAPTVNNTQISSFWMRNASYIRMKSATLSYTVPADMTRKFKLQNIRLFVSAQNLFTWTKIVNYDPEIIDAQGYNYPLQKVISAGLNITF
jgi:TonB-linked SusC/RagA family outer membrane protein